MADHVRVIDGEVYFSADCLDRMLSEIAGMNRGGYRAMVLELASRFRGYARQAQEAAPEGDMFLKLLPLDVSTSSV